MSDGVVGWFLPRQLEARAIWFDPAKYIWDAEAVNSTTFLHCPAYHNFTRNLFVIRCPFDLHLHCELTSDGCEISVGETSSIRPTELGRLLKVHDQAEWREAGKPLLQLLLNYYFISDDDIEVSYLSPLTTHYFRHPLPGLVMQGRWNIQSWVRPINFVFEWWDVGSDLIIRRGEPILNVAFHGARLGEAYSLVEAEETDEVIAAARQVQNINAYVRNVFSVLPRIKAQRPRRLVVACRKSSR